MSRNISRQEKLDKISGEKYPRDFPGRVSVQNLLDSRTYGPDGKQFESSTIYKIAGRIMSRRDHGNNIFFNLMDQTGEIQLHAKNDDSEQPNKQQEVFSDVLECDLGDMVGVEGTLGENRRREPLLQISNWTLLAKALIEPPDKRHGITEPEVKYRHRERDLISPADSRALFKTRAEIVFEIRKYLNEKDFIEIECPVLQPIYGGATARPFKTFHNSLSQDFFLSISSELYLKRALVGGFDRVYSFSRCFRNEGISPEHNPEFTNLEIFETCKTAQDMEKFVIDLWDYLYKKFNIKNLPWNFQFMHNLMSKDWPLSRKSFYDEDKADAWELFAGDMEIASGASDLNDPREQESRFKESENKATSIDIDKKLDKPFNEIIPDYDPYDQNYIEALEIGSLPWAGVGIGVDRLVMLLTSKTNIRDSIMFPTLKNKT